MATRIAKKKKNGSRSGKIGLAVAALATIGAASLLKSKARRERLAATAAKVGKAAAKKLATTEVVKTAGTLLRRKPRSRISSWLNG